MTGLVLAALLFAHPPSGSDRARADVRVTAADAGGDADPGLASALAQALVDAGLPAAPERGTSDDCRDDCVRVSVRKTDDRGFVIEVRARGGDSALAPVRLDPTASSFDQVHALAIEVELLAGRVHPARRRHARPALVVASPALPLRPEPTDAPGDAAAVEERALPATPPAPASLPTGVAPPAQAPPGRAVPAVHEQAQRTAAPADERLALNVAALVLSGPPDGLFMHGSTVGVRVRLTPRLDARASISFLRPENVEQQGISRHLELLPLAASAAVEIPGLPALRAGAGVEGALVGGEVGGHDGPSSWAIGPIARLEYRHAIRSFALMAALQAAAHPAAWNTARGDDAPAIPLWTVGASLGLEFKVF